LTPDVLQQLLHRQRDPLAALSARVREVLVLLAAGQSNAAIASKLCVTEAEN
jgi:DNA-binding NarL/FixJ family response regulator